MVIFKNLSKNGEMLKNVGENIKKIFALIFFYTLDIRNIILPTFFAISTPNPQTSFIIVSKKAAVSIAIEQ